MQWPPERFRGYGQTRRQTAPRARHKAFVSYYHKDDQGYRECFV